VNTVKSRSALLRCPLAAAAAALHLVDAHGHAAHTAQQEGNLRQAAAKMQHSSREEEGSVCTMPDVSGRMVSPAVTRVTCESGR
jgi:hypothetical protein